MARKNLVLGLTPWRAGSGAGVSARDDRIRFSRDHATERIGPLRALQMIPAVDERRMNVLIAPPLRAFRAGYSP